MAQVIPSPPYRNDIDGLRAIAVLAVIFFHFGCLPSGYLGVDVFFVISGFLITGTIHREIAEGRFSIAHFYLRRTRRILPLVSFVCAVTLPISIFTMLPEDLENYVQSVIATNLFGNNILQAVTTKDYWDVANEFKPLMHTWSLGVEEQYYLLYPLLFLALGARRSSWAGRILLGLACVSLALFLMHTVKHERFYYLPYRFFELALGGVVAMALNGRMIRHVFTPVPAVLLMLLLTVPAPAMLADATLVLTVLTTAALLATANGEHPVTRWILTNRVAIFLGLISFSLYMWHQVVLAYARYFVFSDLGAANLSLILLVTCLLSVGSYYLIEKPFRNPKSIRTSSMLVVVGAAFVMTTGVSWQIHRNQGVLHDVPELEIVRGKTDGGIHVHYNVRIRELDRPFEDSQRIRVLIIGDSFARDWANVLLESNCRDAIQISYVEKSSTHPELKRRADQADVIFVSRPKRGQIARLGDTSKTWVIGTKSFGQSTGYFYSRRSGATRVDRAEIDSKFLEHNARLRRESSNRFIDLIGAVADEKGSVPVYTPDGRFISYDCRHFTIAGAKYFARLLDGQIQSIMAAVSTPERASPIAGAAGRERR